MVKHNLKKIFVLTLLIGCAVLLHAGVIMIRYSWLDESNFDDETAGKLAFLNFTAKHESECLEFDRVFTEVSSEVREGNFYMIDAGMHKNDELKERFNAWVLPHIIAVQDGKVVAEYNKDYHRRWTAANYKKWVRGVIAECGEGNVPAERP